MKCCKLHRRNAKSSVVVTALFAFSISLLSGASGSALASSAKAKSAKSHGDKGHETVVASKSSDHGAKPKHSEKAKSGGHGAGWGYSGKKGPENWGKLSSDYRVCGAGTMQSPLDIAGGFNANGDAIEFDYRLTPLNIVHNGHTVQVNYAPGSGIFVSGERYELLQFHFHTPSEHAIKGQLAAMEVHFVHKNAAGQLAVVGVMMKAGTENPALREIWDSMPKGKSAAKSHDRVMINAPDLLPEDTRYFRYMGSLTTPPCSEGVNWFVLTHPIQVGVEQVGKFAKAAGTNNRPLQERNNRLVLAPGSAE